MTCFWKTLKSSQNSLVCPFLEEFKNIHVFLREFIGILEPLVFYFHKKHSKNLRILWCFVFGRIWNSIRIPNVFQFERNLSLFTFEIIRVFKTIGKNLGSCIFFNVKEFWELHCSIFEKNLKNLGALGVFFLKECERTSELSGVYFLEQLENFHVFLKESKRIFGSLMFSFKKR